MQHKLLLVKGANKAIPGNLIADIAKHYGQSWGFTIVAKSAAEGADDFLHIHSETHNNQVDVKKFEDFQTDLLEHEAIFTFSGKVNDGEDIQPFLLVQHDNGEPILMGTFIGDFSAYAPKKTNRDPAWHYAMEVLAPKLQEIYDGSDEGLELLQKHVRSEAFKKDLEKSWQKEGTILFHDIDGEVVTISNQKTITDEFGWHTPIIIPEPVKVEAPAPQVSKKDARFGSNRGSPAAAASTSTPITSTSVPQVTPKPTAKDARFGSGSRPPAVHNVGATVHVDVKGTDTALAAPAGKDTDIIWVSPPAQMSNNKMKNWYQERTGTYPDGWKSGVAVGIEKSVWDKLSAAKRAIGVVHKEQPGAKPKDFPKAHESTAIADALAEAKKTGTGSFPARGSEIAAQRKDVATHHVGVTAEIVPIIGPEARGKINLMMNQGTLLKTLDPNSVEVTDPRLMNNMEQKVPLFYEALGMVDSSTIDRWSYEQLCKLGRELPDALAKLCFDYRMADLNHRNAHKILDASGQPIKSEPKQEQPIVPVAAPSRKTARFGK